MTRRAVGQKGGSPMIVFSLRRFRSCEGKHMVVDEAASHGTNVLGYLSSASGVVQRSRLDADVTIDFTVLVTDAARLTPLSKDAEEWQQAFLKAQKHGDS